MLFLQLQGLFERVGVRLIDLEAEVGFLDPPARLTRLCNCESRTGTCLSATMIFMWGRELRACAAISVVALENQAAVGAAEAERVRQRVVDLHGPRVIGNVVEIALAGRECSWLMVGGAI